MNRLIIKCLTLIAAISLSLLSPFYAQAEQFYQVRIYDSLNETVVGDLVVDWIDLLELIDLVEHKHQERGLELQVTTFTGLEHNNSTKFFDFDGDSTSLYVNGISENGVAVRVLN